MSGSIFISTIVGFVVASNFRLRLHIFKARKSRSTVAENFWELAYQERAGCDEPGVFSVIDLRFKADFSWNGPPVVLTLASADTDRDQPEGYSAQIEPMLVGSSVSERV